MSATQPTSTAEGKPGYPLSGITVLDLSHVYNGPYAAFLMALAGDRKSTRLNSSHANISYAVFCLKKKMLLRPWLRVLAPIPVHRPAPPAPRPSPARHARTRPAPDDAHAHRPVRGRATPAPPATRF